MNILPYLLFLIIIKLLCIYTKNKHKNYEIKNDYMYKHYNILQ